MASRRRTKRRKQVRHRGRSRRRMHGGMLNEQQQNLIDQLSIYLQSILQQQDIESIKIEEAHDIATKVEKEAKTNTDFKIAVNRTLSGYFDNFSEKCIIANYSSNSIRGAQRIISMIQNIQLSR